MAAAALAPRARLRPGLGRLIAALLVAAPLADLHGRLHAAPRAAVVAAALPLAALLLARLLAFKRWRDELAQLPRFLRALTLLAAVLYAENFATWVVSATDKRRLTYVPLQDNGEIAARWLLRRAPFVRTLIDRWAVDMHYLLYAFLALALSAVADATPYAGFGVGARFMDAVAWTHALRTLAFLATVLPNPRTQCYRHRFPPAPADWATFLRIGLGSKRGAGCNDLVISGHGVVYAAVPLALGEFYPAGGPFSPAALAWAGVARLCVREVLDKTHYSVDMLLAVAVTALVWRARAGAMAGAAAPWRPRRRGAPGDPVPRAAVALVGGVLVLVLVGVAGV